MKDSLAYRGAVLFISVVKFNPEFWSSVLPKLEAFYNEHILVELGYPRVKYGFPSFGDIFKLFKAIFSVTMFVNTSFILP